MHKDQATVGTLSPNGWLKVSVVVEGEWSTPSLVREIASSLQNILSSRSLFREAATSTTQVGTQNITITVTSSEQNTTPEKSGQT